MLTTYQLECGRRYAYALKDQRYFDILWNERVPRPLKERQALQMLRANALEKVNDTRAALQRALRF